MLLTENLEKASDSGAFFYAYSFCRGRQSRIKYFAWLVLLCSGVAQAQSNGLCSADRLDEDVQIAAVIDGDTVHLVDGRKLRLIGINTPELARDNLAAEPLAEKAQQFLQTLLSGAKRVSIRMGAEHQDRYQRWLVHLFVNGRENIQARMLEQGLAAQIAVPPNLWAQDCYRQAERLAQQRQQGVWALTYYQPLATTRLSDEMLGFRHIQGRVMRIARTEHSLWLNLAGDVALHIARQDWSYFSELDLDAWLGKEISARGWLYQRQDQLRMRLRHPNNLRGLNKL